MKSSPKKILLLEPPDKKVKFLSQLLNENGYAVESLCDIELIIEKIMNHSVDLVICDNKVNEYSGFEIFRILKKYLRNCGTPFFMVLDSYEKEDMLIGLEIGVDNFIVFPINNDSVFYKIENHLNKKHQFNIFNSDYFKEYFRTSSVAMFYVSKNKIHSVNDTFGKLGEVCLNNVINLPVEAVFNISENGQNELNYRRFKNGITNHCNLYNISCLITNNVRFDMGFYRGENLGTTHVFAELVPIVSPLHPNKNDKVVVKNKVFSNKETYSNDFESEDSENVQLTEREEEVLQLSANGLPIKIIADELKLSKRTVEKHRANIMAKVKAKNIIEAIIFINNSKNNSLENWVS